MAYIVEPGPNPQLGPTYTSGGGGYDSPHSRRERAARNRKDPAGMSRGTTYLYAQQRKFALEQMRRHNIVPPRGVDPVAYYQQVASKQIYREDHPGLYANQHPAAVQAAAAPPSMAGGNIGLPGPDPSAGVGSMGQGGPSPKAPGGAPPADPAAAFTAAHPQEQNINDPIGPPAPIVGVNGQPIDFSSTYGLGQGPANPPPKRATSPGIPNRTSGPANAAKHKLALALLVSALTAHPPKASGFHPG